MFFRAAQPPNKIRNNYPKINRTNGPRKHPEHTGCAPACRPEPRPQRRICRCLPNVCSKRARSAPIGPAHAASSSQRTLPACRNRWIAWSAPRRTQRAVHRFHPRFCTPQDRGRGAHRGIAVPQSPSHAPRANARRSIRPSHPIAVAVSTRDQIISDTRAGRKPAATRAMKSLHTVASPAESCVARSLRARKRGTSTNFSG